MLCMTQIYNWVGLSTVVKGSANVEKGMNIAENQQCGTTHCHSFVANSVPALNICGNYGACDSHQWVGGFYCISVPFMLTTAPKHISCSTALDLYRDDLSNDSYSSMPSLEWMDSTVSLDVCLPYLCGCLLQFSCTDPLHSLWLWIRHGTLCLPQRLMSLYW